jgi:hypothetical protein
MSTCMPDWGHDDQRLEDRVYWLTFAGFTA